MFRVNCLNPWKPRYLLEKLFEASMTMSRGSGAEVAWAVDGVGAFARGYLQES